MYKSGPVNSVVQGLGWLVVVLIVGMILESLHFTTLGQLFFLMLLMLGMVAISERLVELAKWLAGHRPQWLF
jgi:hypothetical protein